MRKTKLIVTLGPSTDNYNVLKEILRIGVEGIRLNLAHYNEIEFRNRINLLKDVLEDLKKDILIFVDLPGPQVRIRKVGDKKIELKVGDIVGFTYNENKVDLEKKIFYVDYEGFIRDVNVGDKLLIDDGKIVVKVLEIKEDVAYGIVEVGGILKDNRKIIIEGKDFNLNAITERDLELINLTIKKFDIINGVALSFVRKGEDLRYLKDLLGEDYVYLSKIESVDGFKNIKEIAKESDVVIIARGDLGVVFPYYELPFIQRILIKKVKKANKPVIVSTETLTSLIESSRPTRAEVDGIEKLFLEGVDGIMLTNETAISKNPVNVVYIASNLLEKIEYIYFNKISGDNEEEYYIYTNSFEFIRKYSKTRRNIVVNLYTNSKKVYYSSNLYYGVYPNYLDKEVRYSSEFMNLIKIGEKYNKIRVLKFIEENKAKLICLKPSK